VTADADNGGFEFQQGIAEKETLWRLGVMVLGASLWLQMFWNPLATAFLSGEAGLIYVGVYMLPTLALFVALIVDQPAGYLFFVPGSFVPGMVLLPEPDATALLQLHRTLFVVGTLLIYLFTASLVARGGRTASGRVESLEGATRQIEGVYRHYTTLRLAILVVLFGVLVGAGLFDASVTSAIAEHHGEAKLSAQIFIVVFGFFVWCAIAYTTFFIPAANLEYDIRRLSREIDGLAEDATAIRWRLGLVVGSGGAAVGLAFAWRFLL